MRLKLLSVFSMLLVGGSANAAITDCIDYGWLLDCWDLSTADPTSALVDDASSSSGTAAGFTLWDDVNQTTLYAANASDLVAIQNAFDGLALGTTSEMYLYADIETRLNASPSPTEARGEITLTYHPEGSTSGVVAIKPTPATLNQSNVGAGYNATMQKMCADLATADPAPNFSSMEVQFDLHPSGKMETAFITDPLYYWASEVLVENVQVCAR